MKQLLFATIVGFFTVFSTAAQTYESDSSNFIVLADSSSFIDNLVTNDTLYISFSSLGCFHRFSRKLKIIKQENSFKLILYPVNGYRLMEGKKILVKREFVKKYY